MKVLTLKETAERLGIRPRTMYKWLGKGLFPNAYKVNPTAKNSPFRIPVEDVEAFEAQRRQG